MSSVGADKKGTRPQCSAHRESGTCGSRKVCLAEIKERALAGLHKG